MNDDITPELAEQIHDCAIELNQLVKENCHKLSESMAERISLSDSSCVFFQNIGQHYRVLYELRKTKAEICEYLGII